MTDSSAVPATTDLPPDAVEAALWAIVDARGYGGIDDMSQTGETRSVLDSSIQYARAALLAAQPAWEAWLREKVAQEIDLQADQPGWSDQCATGLRIAAELIRPLGRESGTPCERCGKSIDEHPTIDVRDTNTVAVCGEVFVPVRQSREGGVHRPTRSDPETR